MDEIVLDARRPVRVGMLGCGVVGSAVARAMESGFGPLTGSAVLTAVAFRDPDKRRECRLNGVVTTTDPSAVVDSPDVELVIEVMGGLEPAGELVERALQRRKSVISANKLLLGVDGPRLVSTAADTGVHLLYEAAVAAAVPVVRTIKALQLTDRIEVLQGVLNGTANYVLSRMESTGSDLDTALAEARTLGLAEADATRDIDGADSADKLAILSWLAFDDDPARKEIPTFGIEWITQDDVASAARRNQRWRLVATATRDGCARVEPVLLDADQPLARLAGSANGIAITAERGGTLYLQGPGAGGDATASAILADLGQALSDRHDVGTAMIRQSDGRSPPRARRSTEESVTGLSASGVIGTRRLRRRGPA